jgi:hypothetical protein
MADVPHQPDVLAGVRQLTRLVFLLGKIAAALEGSSLATRTLPQEWFADLLTENGLLATEAGTL